MRFIIVLIFSALISQIGAYGEQDKFSYKVGSPNGPERWSSINKEWYACNSGQRQSPIDVPYTNVKLAPELGELRMTYRPSNATLINRGHDIQVSWALGSPGGMDLNGTVYTLKQLHWHSPSEHTLDGFRFPLELHMVHQSTDGKISVVGFVYKIARPDRFLAHLEGSIKKITDVEGAMEDVGKVDPRDVRRGTRKYFRYVGSLTTPPCTEGVVWTLIPKVRTVSKEQLKLLRDAVNDDMENNARPIQSLNGRAVSYYHRRK